MQTSKATRQRIADRLLRANTEINIIIGEGCREIESPDTDLLYMCRRTRARVEDELLKACDVINGELL